MTNLSWRGMSSFVLATAVALIASPLVSAQSPTGPDTRLDSSPGTDASTASVQPVCQDPAYNLLGGHWNKTVHWTFKSDSTPPGLGVAATETALVNAYNNITGAHNDCGRPDNVGAQNVYDGRSTRAANINRWAECSGSDGHNVIAFGRLPAGVLAVTCTQTSGHLIVEADIVINRLYAWATSMSSCSGQEELIEPTITHEVGHVFGLAHVSERKHPLMTMSTASDGACSNAASTLGLGDMLGLEALY